MYNRRKTRTVYVGGVPIGGNNPIVIQSMTNTDTRDIHATSAQIKRLAEAGCELVRVAVPDAEAAAAFREIKKLSPIPVAADIHFNYRLALTAIENGADKLRINPGNIGGAARVREVAEAARRSGIPIRVGVNGGSLEKELLAKHNGVNAEALCESAVNHVRMLEDCGFNDIVIAVKGSSVPLTIEAYRLLSERAGDYPLHIGITEAGTPYGGTVKSAAGIGALLAMGLGDTLRVSLTGDPVEEVRCAKEILKAMGLRSFGATVISCPTCGRTETDLIEITKQVEEFCATLTQPITVAVMGCVVNGPGEAREADYGVSCGRAQGIVFRKGEKICSVPQEKLAEALIAEIRAGLGLETA